MGKYKIGSHNSFSFERPDGILSWILRFAGRCQSKSIYEQYAVYGATWFDLRIFPEDELGFSIRHGIVKFKTDKFVDYMHYLQEAAEDEKRFRNGKIYVRVILEQNRRHKYQEAIENDFREWCARFVESYPKITFIGGQRKFDWKKVYNFGTEEPSITDRCSSTASIFNPDKPSKGWLSYIDDWWPWLYAKLWNHKNRQKSYNTDYLLLDFVNIE